MITTFIDKPMISSRLADRVEGLKRAAIIAVLVLLSGCSAIRLAYNNAPQFAWWWIDGYMDFSSEHSGKLKESLDQWFDWHRQTQLVPYANWLVTIEKRLAEPTTGAEVCAWFDQAREKAQPAIDRAMMAASEHLPALGLAQIAHLEQRYAKNNAEFRELYLKGDANERMKTRRKRSIESAERIYGKLGPAQIKVIEANLASSPFDPATSLLEREKRQREILATMRRWVAEKPDRGVFLASMRQMLDNAERPTDPAQRASQQRFTDHSCRAAAELHNSTTPAQRLAAKKQLKSWEEDLRALAAERG
jgi:Family of unknown function (DUF6279)